MKDELTQNLLTVRLCKHSFNIICITFKVSVVPKYSSVHLSSQHTCMRERSNVPEHHQPEGKVVHQHVQPLIIVVQKFTHPPVTSLTISKLSRGTKHHIKQRLKLLYWTFVFKQNRIKYSEVRSGQKSLFQFIPACIAVLAQFIF